MREGRAVHSQQWLLSSSRPKGKSFFVTTCPILHALGFPVANVEVNYICDSCGEEIVIPLDLSAGDRQQFVEDCPVCCRPSVIHVEIDDTGEASAWAEPE